MSAKNFADIHKAIQHLRAGSWKVRELAEACLTAMKKDNDRINAVIFTNPQFMEEAEELDKEAAQGHWRGPLHGIPLLVKDNMDVCGMPSTMASALFEAHPATADAGSVARLRAAGALILGKANMDELASHISGISSCKGPALNPWNKEHALSPGGSSSGAAAGIASGFAMAAIGSDTGGSVRLPAAWCGLCGLRPTHGQVVSTRCYPRSVSLDTVTPMARSVRDTALLYHILTHPAGVESAPQEDVTPQQGWRIAVLPAKSLALLDDNVRESYLQTLEQWRTLPVHMEELDIPLLRDADMVETLNTIRSYEFARDISGDMVGKPWTEKMHAIPLADFRKGLAYTPADYQQALEKAAQYRAETLRLLSWQHALLLPVASSTALHVESSLEVFAKARALLDLFSLVGGPTLVLPGLPAQNMPSGIQLVGNLHSEPFLLALGRSYEHAYGPFPHLS